MDKVLSVIDRIEHVAELGRIGMELNLYTGQIRNLLKNGFAIQQCYPVPGWKGQFHCRIGWRYVLPGTQAFKCLELAAANNEQLRLSLKDPEANSITPPCSSGWPLY